MGLSELTTEIVAVGESHVECNIRNTSIGASQQPTGFFNPKRNVVLNGGCPHRGLEHANVVGS